METTNSTSNHDSKLGWIFGGLSFIPLFGVLFGILAIIIGIRNKARGQVLLGATGIALTVILYGSLFYFGFVAKTGVFADLKVKLADQILTDDAGAISLYKIQHGTFPQKLSDLGSPSEKNMIFPKDPWNTDISYTIKAGEHFELRSAGPDEKMNTADDISKIF